MRIRVIVPVMSCLLSSFAFAAGDVDEGKELYGTRCAVCHSPDFNGVGPAHKGVFGRRAGTAPGYAYSQSLKAATLTWDADNLDRWLTDPEKLLPGQKMGVNVPDATDRANLIAYLAQLKAK